MFSSNTSQVSQDQVFIEDVFSTYLYTGNGSTQTITNGIDLAGKGGLTWIKNRGAAQSHGLSDTARGAGNWMSSDLTVGNIANNNGGVSAFTSSGFSVNTSDQQVNGNNNTYASWTFRKQPKFFDIQTFSVTGGTGAATFSHNLGSTPGCIFIKRTDASGDSWVVYHRSLPANNVLFLNLTLAQYTPGYTIFTSVTSTSVSVDQYFNNGTYVAYLFAHNAGGFGLTGTDNVISCGSLTTDANGAATVNLGYEPQFVIFKSATSAENWYMSDVMRGMYASTQMGNVLYPSLSNAEAASVRCPFVNATGMSWDGTYNYLAASQTYIYIAIRRGPMKTPTSGTSVYNAVTYTGNQTARNITGYGFPLDLVLGGRRNDTNNFKDYWFDRLRGATKAIDTNVSGGTAAEYTDAQVQTSFALQDGTSVGTDSTWNATGINIVLWGLRRAPGFFDEVCYTGTGSARTVSHNLGVVPELMIVKRRNSSVYGDWYVYTAAQGATKFLLLNLTDAVATSSGPWNNTAPTSSVFTAGSDLSINSTATYVAYLFATVAGVSKVGSYTGTGTTLQIDCGFTGGARFVLIKRTDSTGDWYVWDSARGIVAGSDPYLTLNSTAAEVTTTDWVDTHSAGFELSNSAGNNVNINGATYIFLSVA